MYTESHRRIHVDHTIRAKSLMMSCPTMSHRVASNKYDEYDNSEHWEYNWNRL